MWTYEEMIEELLASEEIEENEKIVLVDYNNWPVVECMLIVEILGVYHSEDTATIVVVASDD